MNQVNADMLAALRDLHAFVAVMVGRGPDAIIPEIVTTPIGAPVKIAEIMRDAGAAIAQAEALSPAADMEKAIEAAAKVIAELPTIDAPKLPALAWHGSARAILEAALPFLTASPHDMIADLNFLKAFWRTEPSCLGLNCDAECNPMSAHCGRAAEVFERHNAALTASPHAVEREWQPIETAPTGEDDFYLVCAEGDDRSPFVVRGSIFASARKHPPTHHLSLAYLTHWQPLPAPPHRAGDDSTGADNTEKRSG